MKTVIGTGPEFNKDMTRLDFGPGIRWDPLESSGNFRFGKIVIYLLAGRMGESVTGIGLYKDMPQHYVP